MKYLIGLSFSYIKKQKSRTVILMTGVALAVMLIFGFNVISESQSKNQLNAIYNVYGSYHAKFSDLDKEDIKKLERDKSITNVNTVASLGNISYKNGTKMQLESSDEGYMKVQKYKIKEGKLPSKNNEIVIEKKALDEMGLDKKLNQKIKMKVKKEYKDEKGINQVFIEEKLFKLVGIIEKPKIYYDNFYYLKAFTYFEEGNTNVIPKNLVSYTGVVSLKSGIKNIDANLNEIRTKNKIGRLDYEPNNQLITAINDYNASQNKEAQKDTKLLVMITSIFLIYNLFNISLTEMINQIGTLRTIGASKRHIRIILTIQSVMIFSVGTIAGILGGLIFSLLGMKVFNFTGTNIDTSLAKVYISSKSVIDAIKIGGITVFISSMIPVYISGKISPLEAIRKISISNKKQKEKIHHKVIRKVFGISGEMAYKNIWRNKFRTFISILSISIAGTLFIDTISSATSDSNDKTNISISNMADKSFNLSYGANADTDLVGYTDNDVKRLSNISGVKYVKTKYETGGFLNIEPRNLYEEYKKYNGIKAVNENVEVPMIIKMYDNAQLNGYRDFEKEGDLQSINHSKDSYPNVIVFNNYYDILQDNKTKSVVKDLNIGDLITIKIPVIEKDSLIYKERKVRVSALLDTRWIFEGDSTRGRYPEIIMSQNDLANITQKNTYSQISIVSEEGKDNQINNKLNEFLADKPWAHKESKLQYKNEDSKYIIEGVKSQMIIISLILLIAILNIFCNIRTSILLRINEFSTLRAIGMSDRQIKIMIINESIIYGILSSLIAAVLGSYKYYSFVKVMNMDYANAFNMETIEVFKIPIVEILIFSIVAMIICILSAYLSNKKIEKINIIDGINISE